MRRLHLAACSLILIGCMGLSMTQQLGFLRRYEHVVHQLDKYVMERGLANTLKDKGNVKWIEQKLNHFNPASAETWSQLYAVDKQYYKDNNVIFLMISGESQMSTAWLAAGFMAEQAKKFKAATFVVEHRFYGLSKPKPNLETESLRYLSSEQALADLAHFITRMNIEHGFTNPKWIVFGGSYAGSLAAWLRYKYPHLVYAAVSSSGPLHAKIDFPEYFETVTRVLSDVTPKCVEAIRLASQKISEGVRDKTKRKHYRELFNLCEPLDDDEKDITTFFLALANSFAGIVQYAEPEKIMSDLGGRDTKKEACDIMTDEKIKCPVHRYAKWMKQRYTRYCLDHKYSSVVNWLRNTTIPDEFNFYRQWLYQTCTEFGWYQTSSKKTDPFGDKLPAKYFVDMCGDVYNAKFDEAFLNKSMEETNLNYGGYSLPVSRVAFVHGRNDPWSPLGITKKPPKGSYAILIKGASHCADMMPLTSVSPPALVRAQKKISHFIQRWISGKNHQPEKQSVFHF